MAYLTPSSPPAGQPKTRLYVMRGCPFGHRAVIALAEKQIDAELVVFERGHRPPELEAASPRAKSPTLFCGDDKVYESGVVLEYLEDRFPQPSLLAHGAAGRAEARMFITRVAEETAPRVGALIAESTKADQDGKKVDQALQALREHLKTLDQHFALRPFAAANAFSLADIHLYPFFPVIQRASGFEVGGEMPHLRGWLERVGGRASTVVG
jgi:stringent starvation protein A